MCCWEPTQRCWEPTDGSRRSALLGADATVLGADATVADTALLGANTASNTALLGADTALLGVNTSADVAMYHIFRFTPGEVPASGTPPDVHLPLDVHLGVRGAGEVPLWPLKAGVHSDQSPVMLQSSGTIPAV